MLLLFLECLSVYRWYLYLSEASHVNTSVKPGLSPLLVHFTYTKVIQKETSIRGRLEGRFLYGAAVYCLPAEHFRQFLLTFSLTITVWICMSFAISQRLFHSAKRNRNKENTSSLSIPLVVSGTCSYRMLQRQWHQSSLSIKVVEPYRAPHSLR